MRSLEFRSFILSLVHESRRTTHLHVLHSSHHRVVPGSQARLRYPLPGLRQQLLLLAAKDAHPYYLKSNGMDSSRASSISLRFSTNHLTEIRWNLRNFLKKCSSSSIEGVIKIIRSSAKKRGEIVRDRERERESEKGAERERILIDPGHRL